jgi:hypothetical protein
MLVSRKPGVKPLPRCFGDSLRTSVEIEPVDCDSKCYAIQEQGLGIDTLALDTGQRTPISQFWSSAQDVEACYHCAEGEPWLIASRCLLFLGSCALHGFFDSYGVLSIPLSGGAVRSSV